MSAEEILRLSESAALKNNQIISHVNGKKSKNSLGKKIKSLGAVGFITAILVVFLVLFGSGNLIPSAISERLIEETDVQYADAVQSKILVFQQALYAGDIPANTAERLKKKNVLVGYIDGNGDFVEDNDSGISSVLKMNDKIITADNFVTEVSNNVVLYDAFNEATYSRAAYYYDDAAKEVFKKIGTTRNNYTGNSDFDRVMKSLIGEGSDIDVNNASLVEKTKVNEKTGAEEIYYEYDLDGNAAKSSSDVAGFINEVGEKNLAKTSAEATLNAADTLKVADTISKEQRSSLFFLVFMENISKMKAGEGNESKINEAMNYLYQSAESEVVDVKTGEVVRTYGTPLDSPSLYAILSGEKIDANKVENYSSDRVLKTVESQLGVANGGATTNETIASTSSKVKGSIGRLISNGVEKASSAILDLVAPTMSKSLVDNSYETIKGVNAGEFLVEGAVNVGKELAKASGGTPGDAAAVVAYSRLNQNIIAMDAAADRMNRSPFDITSKNTFLGSIIYNFGVNLRLSSDSTLSRVGSFMATTAKAISSLTLSSYADSVDGYLSVFGDCETYGRIGVVGSAGCSEIATFDVTTLNNPYGDAEFIKFVEENTTLNESGVRTINNDSILAGFIKNNDNRTTPLGVMDGGILDSLNQNSDSVPFISDILGMIKKFISSSDEEKRIASGAAFVNSSNNPDWQKYKYAQRYVSLARATDALRQYSGDATAYNNILYFEGNENPVIAFLNDYYALNN